MAKCSKKTKKQQPSTPGLAIVIVEKELRKAKDYETLLKASDIPAMVREQNDEITGDGFALLVPEDHLDEAHVIIESQNAYDDFYDIILDDEDFDDDFPDDF